MGFRLLKEGLDLKRWNLKRNLNILKIENQRLQDELSRAHYIGGSAIQKLEELKRMKEGLDESEKGRRASKALIKD